MALKRFPIARLPCPHCGMTVVLTKRYDLRMTGESRKRQRKKKEDAKNGNTG